MDRVETPFRFQPIVSLLNGPPIGVRFRESLVIRLHSEIDQIHLSIEAQCVTTVLPLGDCHTSYGVQMPTWAWYHDPCPPDSPPHLPNNSIIKHLEVLHIPVILKCFV